MGQLTGKIALITGAGSGLGQAAATALAAEGAIAVVTELPDRLARAEATVATIKGAGGEAHAVALDVLDLASIAACVEAAARIAGRIDILVNNAGVNVRRKAYEVSEADWDAVVDVNLKGVFFMAQAVGLRMRDQDPAGGCIINVASQMGLVGYYDRAAYCSSKAGVVNLSRALAIEWAPDHIRVNTVCPTFVDTPLTRPMFENNPEMGQDILNRILNHRLATADEIAAGIVYLASPGAAMVNGHALTIDGGWTAI